MLKRLAFKWVYINIVAIRIFLKLAIHVYILEFATYVLNTTIDGNVIYSFACGLCIKIVLLTLQLIYMGFVLYGPSLAIEAGML